MVALLESLRAHGGLTSHHVRLATDGLGVSERTVWRSLGGYGAGPRRSFGLGAAEGETFAFYSGNVATVHEERSAVLAGRAEAAVVPLPGFLAEGWRGAAPVAECALYRAFEAALTRPILPRGGSANPGAGCGRTTPTTQTRCPSPSLPSETPLDYAVDEDGT